MKAQILASLLLVSSLSFAEELSSLTNFDQAAAAARDTDRDILIEFTGTGWCTFCQDMRNRLFKLEAFREWMAEDYVWLEVDYVFDKWRLQALPPAQVAHDTEMRKRYLVRLYPSIVLCDPEGRPYAMKEGFTPDASTEEYFYQLGQLTGNRKLRDEALAKAEASTGAARLDAIAQALAVVPQRAVERFYPRLLAELQQGRPEASLVKAIAREKELGALESDLRQRLSGQNYQQALDDAEAVLRAGSYSGEERQRFLLVKARALAGLKRREETVEVVEEILEIDPDSQYAGRAKSISRFFGQSNLPGDKGGRIRPGGPSLPRTNPDPVAGVHEPLEIESADLSKSSAGVLRSYQTKVVGALERARDLVEKEHRQWEDLYRKRKDLIDKAGPEDPGVAEFDRIIGALKQQHEITHRRESDLLAFKEKIERLAHERYQAEQAELETEAEKLLEESGEVRDKAEKLLEEE